MDRKSGFIGVRTRFTRISQPAIVFAFVEDATAFGLIKLPEGKKSEVLFSSSEDDWSSVLGVVAQPYPKMQTPKNKGQPKSDDLYSSSETDEATGGGVNGLARSPKDRS